MALHIGYQYVVAGQVRTGQSLAFGLTRTAPPAARYDFSTGAFTTGPPVTPTSALSEEATAGFYAAVLPSAVTGTWNDGEYQVTILDQGAGVTTRNLYAELVRGDDGSESPPQVVASHHDLVLKDVRQALVDAGLFLDNTAVVSLNPEWVFPTMGGPTAIVSPGDMRLVETREAGGGRLVTNLNGTFHVLIMDRRATDRMEQDRNRLLAFSTGLLRRAEGVINTLEEYFPIDAAGNHLTNEGLKLSGALRPYRDKDAPEWAGMVMEWTLDLNVALAGI
jgi:hypothetical protein